MYIYNSQENAIYQKFRENNSFDIVNQVNRNFKIKIYGLGFNKLVGVFGLLQIVGIDLTNMLLNNALRSKNDVYTARLRRGLTVTFYSH